MQHRIIAIIPARGSNDEVDHLNIKQLGGKPLLVYTIEAALQSAHVQRVIVSTEDRKIARIAQENGAEVPFLRPVELVGDRVGLADVAKHVLVALEKNENTVFDIVITLLPNCPFRTSKDIDSAVGMLIKGPYDSVMSVVEERDFFWIEEKPRMVPLTHRHALRRKDCVPIYREAGGLYVVWRANYAGSNHFGENIGYYIINQHNGRTINTLYDLFTSERLIRLPSELIEGLLNSE